MKNKILLISLMLVCCHALIAKDLKGKITTAETGEPIPGANIVVKGTHSGTISDFDGNYLLNVESKEITVIVSFLGCLTKEIVVAPNQTKLDVALKEDNQTLDEVVVVGYGVEKKKLSTGATINVKGEDLQKLNTVNPLGALQSQAAGVNITQQSGMPGQGFLVQIRGLGTNGDSAPLYVIDGIAGGDINSLNPSDIESIDVLKDAASSAIYGSRAANGVILVTTKQGKEGKTQISYDGYFGIQNVYKTAPLLNAREYMTIQDEINFNEGLAATDWANLIPELYDRVQNGWNGTNWLNEMMNKNASVQNHALNFSGGTSKSTFSVGLSYTSQEGTMGKPVAPTYERYTARINSEHILYKNDKNIDVLKFGESINYNYREDKGISIWNMWDNDLRNAMTTTPLMPLYNADGDYFAYDDVIASGYDKIAQDFNPIGKMDYNNRSKESKNHGLNANLYFELQPVKNLVFKTSFGYRMSAGTSRKLTPEYRLNNIEKRDEALVEQSMYVGANIQWENTLRYNFNVKQHNFTALVGQSIEKNGMGQNLKINNVNYNFSDWEHAYINNTSGYTAGKTSYEGYPWGDNKLASFFGRLNYNYNEKYMASFVLRADGSSNFAPGKRWGYFPSASAGWVISEESFLKENKSVMDFLKLRFSWGQNGNASVDGFQYLATISYKDYDSNIHYPFGNDKDPVTPGAYPDILPNTNLSWETSEQYNFGFDSRFFDSRLGFTFDYYKKTTKDWLVRAPQLLSYGTGAPYINGGDVENKGIELNLRWNDNVGKFHYGFFANLSYNKNEVLRIANSEGVIYGPEGVLSQGTSAVSKIEVGKPMGFFWGYKTAGVFQNNEQIANTKTTYQENPQPGDLIFVDTNGDGVIDEKDKTMIGNPHPDFILGIGANFAYKGFDFSITANGSFGQQIMKSYRSFTDSRYHNYTTDIFDRWHGEGTSNRLPRLTSGGNANWKEISDIYVEDADYLKIQNITLGYDFKRLIKTNVISQLRLYVSAQNICTFTKYSGMDPEIGYRQDDLNWATGVDLGFFPSPRTYMVGLNVKF